MTADLAARPCQGCGTDLAEVVTAGGKRLVVEATGDDSRGTVWIESLSGRLVAHPLGVDAVRAHRRARIPLHRTHPTRCTKGRP